MSQVPDSSLVKSIVSSYELKPGEPVSEAVVMAVAAFESCEPTALPRLYDTVDPDALDCLFESSGDGNLDVTLTYAECEIRIGTGGRITVTEAN